MSKLVALVESRRQTDVSALLEKVMQSAIMKGDAEGVRVTVEASGALNSGVDIHPYAAMLRIMLKNEKLNISGF